MFTVINTFWTLSGMNGFPLQLFITLDVLHLWGSNFRPAAVNSNVVFLPGISLSLHHSPGDLSAVFLCSLSISQSSLPSAPLSLAPHPCLGRDFPVQSNAEEFCSGVKELPEKFVGPLPSSSVIRGMRFKGPQHSAVTNCTSPLKDSNRGEGLRRGLAATESLSLSWLK